MCQLKGFHVAMTTIKLSFPMPDFGNDDQEHFVMDLMCLCSAVALLPFCCAVALQLLPFCGGAVAGAAAVGCLRSEGGGGGRL